ncbi:MAG: hypothetical protein KY475_01175 [Planctomycetes bacterium]|nr:hypothetical protein [Planctomycetota bacterium]
MAGFHALETQTARFAARRADAAMVRALCGHLVNAEKPSNPRGEHRKN